MTNGHIYQPSTDALFTNNQLPENVFRKKFDLYCFFNYDDFLNGLYFRLLQSLERELNGEVIYLHTLEKELGEAQSYQYRQKGEPYLSLILDVNANPSTEWMEAMNVRKDELSYYAEWCINPVLYGSTDKWALYLHKWDELGVLGFDDTLEGIIKSAIKNDYLDIFTAESASKIPLYQSGYSNDSTFFLRLAQNYPSLDFI